MNDETRISPYDYNFDPAGTSTAARLSRLVGVRRRVLELGCGYGVITRQLVAEQDCKVTGVERDVQSAESAKRWLDDLIIADLDEPSWLARAAAKFEVVVAADVIEHLRNPEALLRRLHGVLDRDGFLVLSVPNVGHAGVIAGLLCGRFDYTPTGILDETHLRFFTWNSLEAILNVAGFEVIHRETVDAPGSHEQFIESWIKLPAIIRTMLGSHPTANVFQYVLKARPSELPKKFFCDDGMLLSTWHDQATTLGAK